MKLHKRTRRSIAGLLALSMVGATAAEAGLMDKFKELLVQTGATAENVSNKYWTGGDSLGNTAINGTKAVVKGDKKWHEAFNEVAGAEAAARTQALTDVTALLKILHDIVMWLPRKLKELFEKLMGKVENFIKKLDAMNQGATVKERFDNLVSGGAGGGGGGDAAAVMDTGDLAAELDDLPAAPSAARASANQLPSIDGAFAGMLQAAKQISDDDKRKDAARRIASTWVRAMSLALRKDSREGVAKLWSESSDFYSMNAAAMHEAISKVTHEVGTPLAKVVEKSSARVARASRLHSAR